jgi:hypothetical protein
MMTCQCESHVSLSDLPALQEDAVFSLQKIEKVSLPHPYCIGTKHVVYASDNYSGRLGEDAIRDAEKHGAHCEMKGCNLSYDEHESPLTLFIRVPQNKDLNTIPGLHAYLLAVKEANLGIEGFAFPTKE